jgi:uracil-DNA glycosylase family 4
MTPDRTKAARDLLAFYQEAGVDTPMGEAPFHRLAAPSELSPPPRTERAANETAVAPAVTARPPLQMPTVPLFGTSPAIAAPPPPDEAALAAREAAKSAPDLETLRAILDKFEGCGLRVHAKQLVFADGNPKARLMFVGEAPGRDEDIEGLPFVGRSGKLLDRMNAAIGLARTDVYIANIVPWRPPGNRTPTPQEATICLPFLLRQIELVNPDILVCLGGPSAQTLLGFKEGIKRMRGRWFTFDTGTREIKAIATFHPAYLLRTPLEKRFAWRDFLAIKKALG